jgi:hypothetical protein
MDVCIVCIFKTFMIYVIVNHLMIDNITSNIYPALSLTLSLLTNLRYGREWLHFLKQFLYF